MSKQDKRYCPYCGHELPPGEVWYCPYCGSSLRGVQLGTGSVYANPEQPSRSMRRRPGGVLAVGILSILAGAVLLFFGAMMFLLRVFLTPSLLKQINSQFLSAYGITVTYSEMMSYSLYMGIAFLVISVLMLVSAVGLLAMKRWGLVLSIAIALLMVFSSLLYVVILFNFAFLFVFLVSLAILIYLLKSRAAFRRLLTRDKHNCDRLIS